MQSPGIAFLDRDGTINVSPPDSGYVTQAEGLTLIPGAAGAIRRLNEAHIAVAVVTNQRGISLGLMTDRDLEAVHTRLRELLAEEAGARLDAIFCCPHGRGACRCRKPLPGMLEQAEVFFGRFEKSASVMIGDSLTDIQAGSAFGVPGMLLGQNALDLEDAVNQFLSSDRGHDMPGATSSESFSPQGPQAQS